MELYLNRIDGIDDAIISMFLSKRTLTRELELEVRREVAAYTNARSLGGIPFGAICTEPSDQLNGWLDTLFKWGWSHITLLRFIDLSFSVYGLHRGGQDDLDAHSMRMNNRITRSSTRLADFSRGETSDYYADKIIPTDLALAQLGIALPDELVRDGVPYVRASNGYIRKGMERDKDVKRGLYMLSIPSNFIFRVQLTEFAHIYKERRKEGGANPEVKQAVEGMADQLEVFTNGHIDRELLLKIKN